jgi:uncharacterized protein (TIGR00369 family)
LKDAMKKTDLKKKLNATFQTNPFLKLMEFQVESFQKDKAVLSVICNHDTMSFQGSLYGGVLSFAADVAIWAALLGTGFKGRVVTTDLTMHYLDRFEKGKALLEATILRSGKRMIMGEVNVYNHKRKLGAHATAGFLRL